jgi:hypothetical protein
VVMRYRPGQSLALFGFVHRHFGLFRGHFGFGIGRLILVVIVIGGVAMAFSRSRSRSSGRKPPSDPPYPRS